ncbi:MAG: 5-formyltetrahydrofolate cyclo-ligase [Gammaproteobacteria bacterium]
MIQFNKQALRNILRAKRRALSSDYITQCSIQVAQRLQTSTLFQPQSHVAIYATFDGEIDLIPTVNYLWQQQCTCYLPIISTTDNSMVFQRYPKDSKLVENKFAIKEPKPDPEQQISVDKLDIILLPLVGFDMQGSRLGMGAGYYDRALRQLITPTDHTQKIHKPLLIGVGYSWQQVANIPRDPWDVSLHAVVTEQQFIAFDL